ncbi:hypothetical protein QCA50_011630 [Cerrena zonata]|uniref:Uncharacterized protein n=1 Tax=Cerrena zonata TaxID=2478898 RepID=A0AAW0FYR4_9APHY
MTPNTSLSTIANRSAVEKVSATLSFKARAIARQKLKERLHEQYVGLDAAGHQLLQTLQTDSIASGSGGVARDVTNNDVPMPDASPDDWVEDGDDGNDDSGLPNNDNMQIVHTMSNLHWTRGQRTRHPRSWQLHRRQEMSVWNPLIEPMTDAYIKWKYGHSVPSLPPESNEPLLPDEGSPQAYTLITPVLPEAAIGFRTLELFHRIRSRKASVSIEAFTRVICDYYMIPFQRHLRMILSETYEIYLRMLRLIDKRIATALGRNTPNWRVKNACTTCCYVLEDKPELKYTRMWAHDGNNSLKQVLPYGNRVAAVLHENGFMHEHNSKRLTINPQREYYS